MLAFGPGHRPPVVATSGPAATTVSPAVRGGSRTTSTYGAPIVGGPARGKGRYAARGYSREMESDTPAATLDGVQTSLEVGPPTVAATATDTKAKEGPGLGCATHTTTVTARSGRQRTSGRTWSAARGTWSIATATTGAPATSGTLGGGRAALTTSSTPAICSVRCRGSGSASPGGEDAGLLGGYATPPRASTAITRGTRRPG